MTQEPGVTASGAYAELLIRLLRESGEVRRVELAFTRPGADAATEPEAGEARIDQVELEGLRDEPNAYARRLTEMFFGDAKVQASFQSAVSAAEVLGLRLRVRLQLDTDDTALHGICWELLCDPGGTPLATSERVLFSRYLRSPDWRRIVQRPKSDLSALVVIASPADISRFAPEGPPLQRLDVATELDQAQAVLGDIPITTLARPGAATLDNLLQQLRRGPDILYLVCHGALMRGQPLLYLEDDLGNTSVSTGLELSEGLEQLRELPTLVVLASCQSAGSGSSGATTAVGPLLARAGVPSVVAMNGKITVQTAREFMRRFFTELSHDGQIDRAVAVARAGVKGRPDAWMPVLFTRQASGRIWSIQSSAGDSRFQPWDALLTKIQEGRCTPILGPGLIEFLLGSPREVAGRWADRYRFPLASQNRQDLPQVAQYLAVNQRDPEFPRAALEAYLKEEMRERYGDQMTEDLRGAPLNDMIREVWRQRRGREPREPHQFLARLPLPVYITTNPDNLLVEALVEAGKQPCVELCAWNDDIEWSPSTRNRDYRPTAQEPLVYYLFGQLGRRESLVLTEDDYFDYLIGVTKRDDIIPPPVVRAWNDNALLFLGFQVDDWNFRVLFRSIMNQEGRERRRKKPHVAVQIDPEEGRSLDPIGARQYLERYFQDENINIYWGSPEAFVRELAARWQLTATEPTSAPITPAAAVDA